jgi:transcription-repair coupling factor (superfamily II helicase)
MSEVLLSEEAIRRFRARYTTMFGGNTVDDPLYAAVSSGQRYPGIRALAGRSSTTSSTTSPPTPRTAPLVFDDQAREAFMDRLTQIGDYYQAREDARHEKRTPQSAAPYKPVPPAQLYEMDRAIYELAPPRGVVQLSPFATPDTKQDRRCGRPSSAQLCRRAPGAGRQPVPVGGQPAGPRAQGCAQDDHRVLVGGLARPHGAGAGRPWPERIRAWPRTGATPRRPSPETTALVVLGLETGFATDEMLVLSEQDILGERLLRPQKRKRVS